MSAGPHNDEPQKTASDSAADLALARRILAGDRSAVAEFMATYESAMQSYLGSLARNGRQRTIAQELAAEVVHLCSLPAGSTVEGDKLSIARYSGAGSLGAWLRRVAHFRFINALRRGEFRRTTLSGDLDEGADLGAMAKSGDEMPQIDAEWLAVIREAMQAAMRQVGEEHPEGLVFLRLVHVYGIKRQLLASLWQRHAAQVTRWLQESGDRIKTLTLATLREIDPHFELQWDDLVQAIASDREDQPEPEE